MKALSKTKAAVKIFAAFSKAPPRLAAPALPDIMFCVVTGFIAGLSTDLILLVDQYNYKAGAGPLPAVKFETNGCGAVPANSPWFKGNLFFGLFRFPFFNY